MDKPSVQDLFLPKKRVIMTTMKVGIKVPAMACRVAEAAVISCR